MKEKMFLQCNEDEREDSEKQTFHELSPHHAIPKSFSGYQKHISRRFFFEREYGNNESLIVFSHLTFCFLATGKPTVSYICYPSVANQSYLWRHKVNNLFYFEM